MKILIIWWQTWTPSVPRRVASLSRREKVPSRKRRENPDKAKVRGCPFLSLDLLVFFQNCLFSLAFVNMSNHWEFSGGQFCLARFSVEREKWRGCVVGLVRLTRLQIVKASLRLSSGKLLQIPCHWRQLSLNSISGRREYVTFCS